MLDCYYIYIGEADPEFPNEDNYIDSFELNEFRELEDFLIFSKSKGIEISYFKDFRLENNLLLDLLPFLKNKIIDSGIRQEKLDAYQKMIFIFENCISKSAGIFCFCD